MAEETSKQTEPSPVAAVAVASQVKEWAKIIVAVASGVGLTLGGAAAVKSEAQAGPQPSQPPMLGATSPPERQVTREEFEEVKAQGIANREQFVGFMVEMRVAMATQGKALERIEQHIDKERR